MGERRVTRKLLFHKCNMNKLRCGLLVMHTAPRARARICRASEKNSKCGVVSPWGNLCRQAASAYTYRRHSWHNFSPLLLKEGEKKSLLSAEWNSTCMICKIRFFFDRYHRALVLKTTRFVHTLFCAGAKTNFAIIIILTNKRVKKVAHSSTPSIPALTRSRITSSREQGALFTYIRTLTNGFYARTTFSLPCCFIGKLFAW